MTLAQTTTDSLPERELEYQSTRMHMSFVSDQFTMLLSHQSSLWRLFLLECVQKWNRIRAVARILLLGGLNESLGGGQV